MKAYQISNPTGLHSLECVEIPSPSPSPGQVPPGQVLVSMQAWSLNYRDLSMPRGGYPRNTKVLDNPPLVPLSDGAGEVIAVGEGVSRFQVGDRVAGCFFENWIDGPITPEALSSARGGAIDGVLAEEVLFSENGLVRIPSSYSFEEAACLPCAGVTAWEALACSTTGGDATILTLGTGGVSLFALQLAKVSGAEVILTSSNEQKLERAKELGASVGINYQQHPEWDTEVLRATDGRGVDHVIELGGAGTFSRSLNSLRIGGHLSLIGVLTGQPEQEPSPMPILFKRICVQGIYVGSRARFESLVDFVETHDIHPIIDRSFAFDQTRQAYEHLKDAAHFGKIVIARS